jgi:hypothetical protein
MSTIITIFKNLGTIVILLFQIVYVSIVDYLSTFDNPKTSTKNKTATSHTKTLRDICWDSSEYSMEDEVVHERPHYED